MPQMVRKRKGRGSHPIPNQILIRVEIRRTCQKSSVFTLTRWDTLPQSFCTIMLVKSSQEEGQVKLLLHNPN